MVPPSMPFLFGGTLVHTPVNCLPVFAVAHQIVWTGSGIFSKIFELLQIL